MVLGVTLHEPVAFAFCISAKLAPTWMIASSADSLSSYQALFLPCFCLFLNVWLVEHSKTLPKVALLQQDMLKVLLSQAFSKDTFSSNVSLIYDFAFLNPSAFDGEGLACTIISVLG